MEKGTIASVTPPSGDNAPYIVDLDDGLKMSTFDGKIKQAEAGDLIEYEVKAVPKGNKTYLNLKDGWKLTKQTSSSTPATAPGGNGAKGYPGMTKAEWAEKDRIERESIEIQSFVRSVFMAASQGAGIPELAGDQFTQIWTKAMDIVERRFDQRLQNAEAPAPKPAAAKPAQQPIPAGEGAPEVIFDSSPISNLGELFTRCKNYGISKDEALQFAHVKSQTELVDLDAAWKLIFARKFNKEGEADWFEEGSA